MYQAKARGKACYAVFDQTMREEARSRMRIENDLRHAIANSELFLLYQPILSLENGEVLGYEALVRWQCPAQGLVWPDKFIPIAEEAGLIYELGAWVLREACRQFVEWRNDLGLAAPPSINVNLSANQLNAPDIVEKIQEILAETGMDPAALKLEITESAVIHDVQHATGILQAIKALGVKLAMDDFGTGYSSLATLRQLPFDTLKIDRSFVHSLDHGRDYIAMIHAVTNLAQNLRIDVVAEGIENREQVVILQSLDCAVGQGYLFAKPMPAEAVPGFVVPWSKIRPTGQTAA
jgi:EAL domain-containing protein (putative c-di-GMP-specific phosphodiesterase class I)